MRPAIFYILISCILACGCASEEEFDPVAVSPVGVEFSDLADEQFREIERFFAIQNYATTRLEGPFPPTPWKRTQFGTVSVTEFSIRSGHEVPGWGDTYYRFHLTVESFADPDSARKRLDRLYERPPATPGSEPDKAFPLRRGFAKGDTVYTLATDVNAFMPELERLVAEFETRAGSGVD